MQKSFLKLFVLSVVTALAVMLPSSALAQNVSSRMTGLVRDTDGKPVNGASVTAVHTPTNTTYTSTTNASGRYVFSGLPVGGPYTVTTSATGFATDPITDITTQLGESVEVNVTARSEVLKLDKIVTTGSRNDLDASATGSSYNIGGGQLGQVATVQRSFADVARTTPFVSLRGVLSSRQQPVISAVGQNNRFNSIQVDGARINDQFGLNGSGLQAFGNPISLDTIEQFNIAISPYDASQSGFTGASINAVTKSGTNQFHGSVYYYYTDQDLQGANVFGSTKGTRALLEQKTKGFTFGGPIIKDRLFFFMNYEKFDSVTPEIAGLNPTGSAQGIADFAAINTQLATIKAAAPGGSAYDFGTFLGPTATINQFNEIKLAKIDWNIAKGQRLSVRYNKTEGELPASGRYTLTNFGSISGSGIAAAPFATNLSSNRFLQARSEEVWAAQLYSQWTPDFKTELRYAQNEYSQATPTSIIFPEIRIFGVSGVANTGASVNNGALVLGTEQNRHGNFVAVKTKSMAATGEYLLNKITLSGGLDREQSDFVNLFRSNSYGVFDYANVAAFLADKPSAFTRSFYQTGTPVDDVSDFAINGVFGQARWDVTPLLAVTLGLRYDFFTSDAKVPLNSQFQQVFGFGNDGSVDGSHDISPRLSFNYALSEERDTQIRGGVGKFVGRIPWVLVSNSYGNSGVGRSQITQTGAAVTTTLASYLQTSFDPAKPIGEAASVSVLRPTINLIEDELKAPTVWRGNIAIDQKLGFLGSTASVEAVVTRNSEALFIQDLNIKKRFVGSDGRQVYAGSVNTAANALHPEFSNVYAVSNIDDGSSTYVSFTLQRPMTRHWSYNLSYTRGSARDALPLGETVAASQYQRNPVFNQNEPTLSRSAFEVKDRVQFTAAREFTFYRNWKTTVSLYYEGRTGNPYSFAYINDANGDGVSGNDLVYVPTGTSDPVLAALTPAVAQSIMDYVNGSELAGYKGKIAPRHAFRMPWTNRLDLHVSQTIGIYKPVEVEVFADFVNFGSWISKSFFGYYETLPGTGDNELLALKTFGNAGYTNDALLQMTGTTFTPPAQIIAANNDLSRWRIQFGARLRF